MQEKKAVIIIVLVVVLVLILGFVWVRQNEHAPSPSAGTGGSNGTASAPPVSDVTKAPVPAGVVVPDRGSQDAPADVAVPQVQLPAALSSNASYRSFNISIDNQEFAPDTIIVKQNDIVNIQLAAVDANYDFTQPDYGFSVPIPEGQTKKIQFSAVTTGKFTFYCSSCGGPQKGPVGYIIVTPE